MNPRIITGSAKGRKLEVPIKGCRPMTDKVKTALFSMINFKIINSTVLDLYAGTGALGIECLSRGAKKTVFIDRSKYAAECINNNLEKTGLKSLGRVIKCSVIRFIKEYDNIENVPQKYDIIFFTPPYNNFKEKTLEKVTVLMKNDTLLITEHPSTRKINLNENKLEIIDTRNYGITGLTFLKLAPE